MTTTPARPGALHSFASPACNRATEIRGRTGPIAESVGTEHGSIWNRSLVVNAAVDKRMDAAEADDSRMRAVNVGGARNLALACSAHNATLVHFSADYVFGEGSRQPLTEQDDPAPLSAYGRSKLDGERAVLDVSAGNYILRTSGLHRAEKPNFVTTMLRLASDTDNVVPVVEDQTGSPTSVDHLVEAVKALAQYKPTPGIYHCANAGAVSWYHLARAVFEHAGADPDRVQPVPTVGLGQRARRPTYCALSCEKWNTAVLPPLPDWKQGLARTLGPSQ